MYLNDKTMQVIINNLHSLDGKIWYAVKSTHIFCKPSCSSRIPKRENIIIYDDPKLALKAGFRSCKRCQPLSTVTSDTVLVNEINYILQNDYAERLTLDELASRVHDSKSHLRHVYKAQTGFTISQKLLQIRLTNAAKILKESNQSITSIGIVVGISNTSYFIKLFKKYYGNSPYQYRLSQKYL